MRKQILSVAIVFITACGFTACNTSNAETQDSNAAVKQEQQVSAPAASPEVAEAPATANTSNTGSEGKVVKLTTQMFIDQIFDYKANPTKWVYKGDKPAIIDFYADWCGPCKRVAPIMEELAAEYKGQVNIYKIDTDHERELAGQVFGIRSIPSILFIPVDGQPTMYTGAYPKEHYVELINSLLLKK